MRSIIVTMKMRWLLVVVALVACRREPAHPSSTEASAAPVDIVSHVLTCSTLAECQERCAAGRGNECAFAGRYYEFGRGVRADVAQAFHFYERSCTLGSVTGCYNEALLLEQGRGTASDQGRAFALYREACRRGAVTACSRAEALGGYAK
jgi:TPR repeat protein